MDRSQFIAEVRGTECNSLYKTFGPFDDMEEAAFEAECYIISLSEEDRFYTEYQIKEIPCY